MQRYPKIKFASAHILHRRQLRVERYTMRGRTHYKNPRTRTQSFRPPLLPYQLDLLRKQRFECENKWIDLVSRSSFQFMVVKIKQKLLRWPITKDIDNPVSQSKLKANTSSWREARENVRERVAIGFVFTSAGLAEKVARFFLNQSLSLLMQNQKKRELLPKIKWKSHYPWTVKWVLCSRTQEPFKFGLFILLP